MKLKPEDQALIEADINSDSLLYLFQGGYGPMLSRILSAARKEGRAPASGDLREKVAAIVDPTAYELAAALENAEGEPEDLRRDATKMRDQRIELALTKADAILNLIGGDGWKPKGDEPPNSSVLGGRWDGETWVSAVVTTPLIQPFTHWRPLPPSPVTP